MSRIKTTTVAHCNRKLAQQFQTPSYRKLRMDPEIK